MDTTKDNLTAAEQAVLEEARKVNEERMRAIEELAAIVAERISLEEQLKENSKEEKRAIREAEKAGWTPAQIKRFMKPPRSQNKTRPSKDNGKTGTQESGDTTSTQSGMINSV